MMEESARSNAISHEVTEVTSKKQKTDKKSGLVGNHGKSPVWGHFQKHFDEETKKYNGVAECNYCHLKIESPSSIGTNKLWSHLKNCKIYQCAKVDETPPLISFVEDQASNWRFDQETCRKSLARMIIACELPFSLVEKEGFRLFCQDINPKFHVVSRSTVTRDCYQIFFEEREKLKNCLIDTSTRVCITSDLWTSIQNLGYMVVTAHFVDKNWKLNKKIINFRVLPHPLKGEAIAKALEGCLLEWGMNKVISLTLDNKKNNETCVVDFKKRLNKRNMLLLEGEMLHVRCLAHVINLVVRDGIDEVKTTIKRLRRSVKYVWSSSSRLQMFKKCIKDEGISSKRIVFVDVKTRWNTTYLMIDAALVFEKAFDRLEDQDASYTNECQGVGTLEDIDWNKLKSLHTFLEDFYVIMNRILGSHYVSSNTYLDEVTQIKDLLVRELGSDDVYRRAMATKMNEKFDKYCGIDSLNMIFFVAIVLDPRYKLDYVVYWYDAYLSNDPILSVESRITKVGKFKDNLKNLLSRLYNHYKAEAISFVDVPSNKSDNGMAKTSEKSKRTTKKDEFRAILKRKYHFDALNDLDRYLGEGMEEDDPNFDVLGWWKGRFATFRALALMARDVLAIPITSVASESAFSCTGRVLDPFRTSLTPNLVECLVCSQDWLRRSTSSVGVEEKLEDLVEIENDFFQEFDGLTIGI